MLSTAEVEAAHGAAQHADKPMDVGAEILHHVLDSPKLELFVPTFGFELPKMHLFGLDVSISKHVVMMWIASAILLVVFSVAARRAKDPVPRGLRNVLEALIVFIRDEVARKAIHDGADRFVGFLLTIFFFILTCNLLGLVPGMSTATGNISVTATLAILSFLMIQFGGMRNNGIVQHFKNLVPQGLPAWLVPLIFLLELLSSFIKPFALCIRLFANMMAGHVVLLAFISLIFIFGAQFSPVMGYAASPIAVGFALFVYTLEILVAFLQAYIFTMLTAQFIGMSVHPAH